MTATLASMLIQSDYHPEVAAEWEYNVYDSNPNRGDLLLGHTLWLRRNHGPMHRRFETYRIRSDFTIDQLGDFIDANATSEYP